ncbi:hypothetical protein WNY39_13630 [Sulfitobacter sp. AS59]
MIINQKNRNTVARFLSFVILTMIGSALFGGIAASLAVAGTSGDLYAAMFTPILTLFGSFFLMPIYFVLFILPSALVFATVLWLVGEKHEYSLRIRIAGTLMALTAATALVGVTHTMRDIAELAKFVAVAAIVIAPFTSWRAFRTQWLTAEKKEGGQ